MALGAGEDITWKGWLFYVLLSKFETDFLLEISMDGISVRKIILGAVHKLR